MVMHQALFRLDTGRVSLDLLATLGNRCGERLHEPGDLAAWLLAAGVLAAPAPASARDLRRAGELRGALFALVDAQLRDGLAREPDVETVNRFARAKAPAPRLAVADGTFVDATPPRDVRTALGVIARDAVDLLTGPDRERLRECAAEDCSGIYVDASRGMRRRWCSTARCGNRARVAAHRERQRAG